MLLRRTEADGGGRRHDRSPKALIARGPTRRLLTKSPCYNGALLSPSLLALLYNEIHLTFRRFLKKNILYQDVETGWIRISQLDNSGWRSSRFSTICIARFFSATPF